ncbi:MAG TPA: hypothetical protein VIF84_09220, partial [Candidatus Limnocylindrales bacterium]
MSSHTRATAAPPRGRRRKASPATYLVIPETPQLEMLLASAVEEVARLLRADGAMLYVIDDVAGVMRLAHQAG